MLRLRGSLDLAGATALLQSVSAAARDGSPAVVCDLNELRDSPQQHLLTVFSAAQHRMGRWPDHELHLAAASPVLGRRLIQLGIDKFVTVHHTVHEALALARGRRQAALLHLDLAPEPGSPAQARRSIDALPDLPHAAWQESAQLVISELATNAVQHVHGPFTLDLALAPTHLFIGVTDDSRQEPILRPSRSAAGHGRGIQLVAALSQSWGVRLIHDAGKTVWARISPVSA